MRYDDLIGSDSKRLDEISRPATRKEVDVVLRKAGYKRLGRGAYGAVYQKTGKDFVLKIFSSKDSAFLDFISFSKRHQDNPHFPKFIGKVVKITPNYYAVRMEILTPYKGNSRAISNYFNYRDYTSDDPSSIIAMTRDDAIEELEAYPHLRAACDLIIDEFENKHGFDIKNDNLMMRGSTVVFSDPISIFNGTNDDVSLWPDEYQDQSNEKGKWSADLDDLYNDLKDAGF